MSTVYVQYDGGLVNAARIESINVSPSYGGRIYARTGADTSSMGFLVAQLLEVAHYDPINPPASEVLDEITGVVTGLAASLTETIETAIFRSGQDKEAYIVRFGRAEGTWIYGLARLSAQGSKPFREGTS